MKVEFSKAFIKASKRLSGKMLDSLKRTIVEVKAAKDIQDISNCKKLVGYRNIYRIRLGDCITYLQQGESSPPYTTPIHAYDERCDPPKSLTFINHE